MTDYLPISLNSLRSNTVTGCDIYLLVHIDETDRYVLYCKGDDLFDNGKRDLLIKKNINKLFINKEDQKNFSEYLETNFQYVLSHGKVSPREKIKIVYNTGINMIQGVYEKPNNTNIVKSRMFAHNMVEFVLQDVRAAYGLLKLQSHEHYTFAHSVNVAALGTLFAHGLGVNKDDLKQLCAGMLFFDLGKTQIEQALLEKKGSLTNEEFEKIKKHPEWGVAILKDTGNGLKEENIIALQHHENFDGSGYPYGLKNEEIHSSAKIVRIIDIYDALTTQRPYANPLSPYDALKTIKNEMSNVVDPIIFKNFIRFLGGYNY